MYFTYLRRELRRRFRQMLVVAAGLAIGIGLVMTVSSASAGVKSAQGEVLHSLYGVGTDITVTKAATAGSGGPQHFNFAAGKPSAGSHVARETLRPTPGQTTLSSSDVATVASLPGASGATGGLVLSATSFSGTIPSSAEGGHTGPGASAEGGSQSGGSSFSINSLSWAVSGCSRQLGAR